MRLLYGTKYSLNQNFWVYAKIFITSSYRLFWDIRAYNKGQNPLQTLETIGFQCDITTQDLIDFATG